MVRSCAPACATTRIRPRSRARRTRLARASSSASSANPQIAAWAYYGRLFIPTNIEDLRAITSAAEAGVAAQPTLPERDDFYEAGVIRRFPAEWWRSSRATTSRAPWHRRQHRSGFGRSRRRSTSTRCRSTGIESVLEVQPPGRVSGYIERGGSTMPMDADRSPADSSRPTPPMSRAVVSTSTTTSAFPWWRPRCTR